MLAFGLEGSGLEIYELFIIVWHCGNPKNLESFDSPAFLAMLRTTPCPHVLTDACHKRQVFNTNR
jgi:hypothetical protein